MKKLLKRIAVVIGVLFALFIALGIYVDATSTPEEKAARQAKIEADKAAKEAQKAKEQAEKDAKEKAEADAKAKAEAEKQAETKEKVVKQSEKSGFGITPNKLNDEITKLLNDALKENHPSGKVSIEEDRFKREYDEHFVWGGNINKDGNVSKVVYAVTKSDDMPAHMTLLLFHAGATARVLSPDLPKEETAGKVGEMMTDVAKKVADTQKDASGEIVVDGYKYNLSVMPSIGTVVAVIERKS